MSEKTSWRNAVEVTADEVTYRCICAEHPAMGGVVRVGTHEGCPMHAPERYQEWLRDIFSIGRQPDAQTAHDRLMDLLEIERRQAAYCAHGRKGGQACPHCLGINDLPHCPNCGGLLVERDCKSRCPSCGYFDDCSRGPT